MFLDYLLLPAIFLLGLITSYQDHKDRKIRNKWILSAFFWGIFIHIFLLVIYLYNPNFLTFFVLEQIAVDLPNYVFRVVLNSTISLIFGYLLWYFKLWAAGDAKLFFAFSLLLPLTHYWRTVFPVFPSFVLLINIFTPLLLFLAFQGLVALLKDGISFKELKEKIIKNKEERLKSIEQVSSFLLFFILIQIIILQLNISFFQQGQGHVFLLIGIFIIHKLLSLIIKKRNILFLTIFGILVYVVGSSLSYFQSIGSEITSIVKSMIIFMSVFSLIKILTLFEKSKDKKRYMPFAYFAFLGVILTILAKGSIINRLMSFLM